jgi:hypothetical protein
MANSWEKWRKYNLSRMQGAAVLHLGGTEKLPWPPRCNFYQRRLSSLASSARRRVTM